MMISPQSYAEDLKNKSYEELLDERYELIDEMWQYENRDKTLDDEVTICPSPDLVYDFNKEYLEQLCLLIGKRYFGMFDNPPEEEFPTYDDGLTVMLNIPLDIEPNIEIKSFKFERGGHFGNYQLFEYKRTKKKRILKYSEEGEEKYFFPPFQAELDADFDIKALEMIRYFTDDFGTNDVCDGEWFSFKATLSNGQKIKSHGYNWFPETYGKFIAYLEHFYYQRV